MRRGGERSSLGKPAPSRPRRRAGTARAARGRAGARYLAGRRRPRPGRPRLPRSPTAAASSRPRTSRRSSGWSARCRSTGSSRPAPTGRSASPRGSPSGAGLPHPISPQTAVLATNKLRQRERLHEAGVPQPRWWVVGGEDALPDVSGPLRREGARPPGPEGADARRRRRPSCRRRSRPRARPPGTAWRSSRSSSTGRR